MISKEMLYKAGLSADSVAAFSDIFDGCPKALYVDAATENAHLFNWDWFAYNFLTMRGFARFNSKVSSEKAICEKTINEHWKLYKANKYQDDIAFNEFSRKVSKAREKLAKEKARLFVEMYMKEPAVLRS